MIRRWLARLFEAAVTALLVVGICVLGVQLYVAIGWAPETLTDDQVPRPPSSLEELTIRARLERIEAAVHVHELRTGALPATLQELVTTGLLDEETIRGPGSDELFYYRVDGDEFLLYPPLFRPSGTIVALPR